MRHYEVVVILNPNQSDQVHSTISRYKTIIEEGNGKVHRYEDWGKRFLAYPIKRFHKGHYVLFNIEVNQETFDRLNAMFKYNDTVIRYLFVKKDAAVTQASPVKEELDNNRANRSRHDRHEGGRSDFRSDFRKDRRETGRNSTGGQSSASRPPVSQPDPQKQDAQKTQPDVVTAEAKAE